MLLDSSILATQQEVLMMKISLKSINITGLGKMKSHRYRQNYKVTEKILDLRK